jgi:membrane-associated protease RseP (regulator of RpoE activity)
VRPPAESRQWVHPSELPSFENLATTTSVRAHAKTPRTVGVIMAILLVVGGIVLMANRGSGTPDGDLPAHLAKSLSALPASSRAAAAATVDLTITTPGHVTEVAAMVLPHDLAVTTTVIPANAMITGSTTKNINFPVTLEGRDNVMGFSIVKLSVPIAALPLDAMPASTAVVAVAPIVNGSTKAPEFDWSMTTLGDPANDTEGVVRYLATQSDTSLSSYVDAIAVDSKGHVVAVLSSKHFWYAATFVAQVADVVATGRGCHADLGITGTSEQGGGVLITKIKAYSAAAHADLKVGDVITELNGVQLDSWDQLASTLYLTPAYTTARLTYDHSSTVLHAIVTLGCPFRLVP